MLFETVLKTVPVTNKLSVKYTNNSVVT